MPEEAQTSSVNAINFEEFKKQVLEDYRLALISREASLIGRKEVLRGKAKFGIFGDGKEVAQIALSKVFKNGDWRSGYYRDQTFAFATGICTVQQFFAQLYADTNMEHEPMSGGRQMNAHFSTRFIDGNGNWLDQTAIKNSSCDSSPTSSQMPRALGLALASKKYRDCDWLKEFSQFSKNGDEVAFATIGDASTSEGSFWETLNAAGVLSVPLAIIVWDDGYGISVPIQYQTTKQNISEIIAGFQCSENANGVDIYSVEGWDYPSLVETFESGIARMRETHLPALFHIKELTQPQGHSTSGSQERYKPKERLDWEREFDCNKKMRDWMIEFALATEEDCNQIETEAKQFAQDARKNAWDDFNAPIRDAYHEVLSMIDALAQSSNSSQEIMAVKDKLAATVDPVKRDILSAAKEALILARNDNSNELDALRGWAQQFETKQKKIYTSNLYVEGKGSALEVTEQKATYDENATELNGFEILNHCFESAFQREPRLFAFGEDLGKIGDVNQGFMGLQAKFGEERIFDTGIREATIVGQGIGMAMRGLRPIAEIQYLDYMLYALQTMSDDLASLSYRSAGTQRAPLIIRTRGHRLEGIWHTGSPMGMIVNAIRGMYLLVPRNMTQAAGFYNTLLQSDDSALIIECLNGYRLKEKLPSNLSEFTVPLGVPEVLIEGTDVTLVTYGSCCRVAAEAIKKLEEVGISVELIDVQTLLPFDLYNKISESVKKTNRVIFLDEDAPGGASAYMLQQVMEKQKIWQYLDSFPVTITAVPNRTAYASDGDYFCKPNADDVFKAVYEMMAEVEPGEFRKAF